MLGAVMVQLKTQLGTGIDNYPFDLEALALVDGFIRTPRARHAPMRNGLAPSRCIETVDDSLYVLGEIAMCDEHSVCRFDDYQVADADRRDHAVFSADIGIRHGILQHVAYKGIALLVVRRNLMQCGPRSDIAPAEIVHRDNCCAIGTLQNCVVHRDAWAVGEGVFAEPEKLQIGMCIFVRLIREAGDVWLVSFQFVQVDTCAKQKNSAVPQVIATGQQFGGERGVRLLDESARATAW